MNNVSVVRFNYFPQLKCHYEGIINHVASILDTLLYVISLYQAHYAMCHGKWQIHANYKSQNV